MTDDETQTNTEPKGKEDNTDTPKPLTPTETLQLLKDTNDATEKELIREQELRAKVSAEQVLGGKTTSEPTPEVKEDTPQEYVAKVMRGEIGDDKE